jgi:DNA topoisomerase IA
MLRKSENKVSLICTSGQLNLSYHIDLDKIKDLEFIYYAGDFDPEGLLIADKIKLKYKEKVKFIFYDEKPIKHKII